MQSLAGKKIWVIGASTGIGHALAVELAKRGAVVNVSARDQGKLDALVVGLGPQHRSYAMDVAKAEDFDRVLSAMGPVDSIIHLAAAYQPMSLLALDAKAVDDIVSINLGGTLNLIRAVTPLIKNGQIEQIALCGSVAGYCGLPNGQPYSATKAAVINLAQSLRAEAPASIDVKLISPGFVRTPLTDKNNFTMPMMIEPEEAAVAIADGLLTNSFEIHFPKKFTFLMKIISLLPYPLYFPIVKKLK